MYTEVSVFARFVLWSIVAISVWTIARDGSLLMASGGLFAAIGQLFAVFFTLILLVVAVLLMCALLCLPLAIYYASSPNLFPERSLVAWLIHFVNPGWKLLWWATWRIRRIWRQL